MSTIQNIGLTDITTVELGNSTIGEDINSKFEKIHNNFNVLSTTDYLKGDKGNSVKIIEFPIGLSVVDSYPEIYELSDLETPLTPEKLYNDLVRIITSESEYELNGLGENGYNKIDLICEEVIENGIVKNIIKGSLPFLYLDPNFSNGQNLSAVKLNYSCLIVYGNDGFKKSTSIPKLYYDENIEDGENNKGSFCWEINGHQTGIIAQGPQGKNGRDGNCYIVKLGGQEDQDQIEIDNENFDKGAKFYEIKQIFVSDENHIGWMDYEDFKENGNQLSIGGSCICIFETYDETYKHKLCFGIVAETGQGMNLTIGVYTNLITNLIDFGSIKLLDALSDISSNSAAGIRGLFVPYTTKANDVQRGHMIWANSISDDPDTPSNEEDHSLHIGPIKNVLNDDLEIDNETIRANELNVHYDNIVFDNGVDINSSHGTIQIDGEEISLNSSHGTIQVGGRGISLDSNGEISLSNKQSKNNIINIKTANIELKSDSLNGKSSILIDDKKININTTNPCVEGDIVDINGLQAVNVNSPQTVKIIGEDVEFGSGSTNLIINKAKTPTKHQITYYDLSGPVHISLSSNEGDYFGKYTFKLLDGVKNIKYGSSDYWGCNLLGMTPIKVKNGITSHIEFWSFFENVGTSDKDILIIPWSVISKINSTINIYNLLSDNLSTYSHDDPDNPLSNANFKIADYLYLVPASDLNLFLETIGAVTNYSDYSPIFQYTILTTHVGIANPMDRWKIYKSSRYSNINIYSMHAYSGEDQANKVTTSVIEQSLKNDIVGNGSWLWIDRLNSKQYYSHWGGHFDDQRGQWDEDFNMKYIKGGSIDLINDPEFLDFFYIWNVEMSVPTSMARLPVVKYKTIIPTQISNIYDADFEFIDVKQISSNEEGSNGLGLTHKEVFKVPISYTMTSMNAYYDELQDVFINCLKFDNLKYGSGDIKFDQCKLNVINNIDINLFNGNINSHSKLLNIITDEININGQYIYINGDQSISDIRQNVGLNDTQTRRVGCTKYLGSGHTNSPGDWKSKLEVNINNSQNKTAIFNTHSINSLLSQGYTIQGEQKPLGFLVIPFAVRVEDTSLITPSIGLKITLSFESGSNNEVEDVKITPSTIISSSGVIYGSLYIDLRGKIFKNINKRTDRINISISGTITATTDINISSPFKYLIVGKISHVNSVPISSGWNSKNINDNETVYYKLVMNDDTYYSDTSNTPIYFDVTPPSTTNIMIIGKDGLYFGNKTHGYQIIETGDNTFSAGSWASSTSTSQS